LHFLANGDRATSLEMLEGEWPQADLIEAPSETESLAEQVFAPATNSQEHPFHLFVKGTNFQVKVLQALLSIPPGSMISYQDVARAIASAIARNPVAYLIPCHRVISKVGEAPGYRWGVERKKAMLGWEASQETDQPRASR
jgi:AraC family transcriptional regulator of adaptative response/methylated-DNA-[protein]-cysteine methyltransferase